jgi:UDP-MurNAc hydroxylase
MIQVTVLGHASLMFQSGEHCVLMDPVLRTTPLMGHLVHQYPRALALERMPAPTMIVITHAHFDHYDIETLEHLPKDVPIVIPPDARMVSRLGELGFQDIRQLAAWEQLTYGLLTLVATPSNAPVTEFGLVVASDDGTVWHMSDAEPLSDTGQRLLRDHGPIDFLTAKFQPADPQLHLHHNMGSSFDREEAAGWLEVAASCDPRLVMAYASGLCFEGEKQWLNHVAYPFDAAFVASLFARRLGDPARAGVAHPGDVLMVHRGMVQVCEQESPFVRQAAPAIDTTWRPYDPRHFERPYSLENAVEIRSALAAALLDGSFSQWLKQQTRSGASLERFRLWQVKSQFTMHLGAQAPWSIHVDFAGDTPIVQEGAATDAAYFMHIDGRAAAEMAAGRSTALRAMIGGNVFIHERMVVVRDGHITAPDTRRLYREFPDPVLTFLGKPRSTAAAQRSTA